MSENTTVMIISLKNSNNLRKLDSLIILNILYEIVKKISFDLLMENFVGALRIEL